MASKKVYSPNASFRGDVAGVTFEDGVGEYDPVKNKSAARYFERHGFTSARRSADDAKAAEAAPQTALEKEAAGESTDARDHAEPAPIGTRLRDAAVDPEPGDFLAPVNAGQEDPHGPAVVAPEIHHEGPKGLKPGDVHVDEPAEQEKDEQALAERVLIEGGEHPHVDHVELAERGPLGMSDPGSVERGVEGAKAVAAADAELATSEGAADTRSMADLRKAAKKLKLTGYSRLTRDELAARVVAAERAG